MIKVLLVEDQRLFRSGVQALINTEADMEVVGMAEDGEEAIELVEALQPDVILMDIHMPNLDGIKATSQIKTLYPDTKIVFLTTNVDEELTIRGIAVGADGFLVKELFPEGLHYAIRQAYRGDVVLAGDVARILVQRIRELTLDKKQILEKRLENAGLRFTKREMDIAYLLQQEKTNKQISNETKLSEGTIKNYISDIYEKLEIHNRDEAIVFLQKLAEI